MPLREYQLHGARWLAHRRRAILADDMGLGKTVQAIAAGRLLKAEKVLVLCPNSLKRNWQEEIRLWHPRAPVTLADGSSQKKLEQATGYASGYFIVNIEAIRAESFPHPKTGKTTYRPNPLVKELLRHQFDVVIVDEAHRFANRQKTLATRGLLQLSRYAPALFLLTGTPVQNRASDLWMLLHLVNGDRWSGFWKFAARYFNGGPDELTGIWGFSDRCEKPDEMQREIGGVVLRRTKEDALPDLPPLTRTNRFVRLEGAQRALYDQMERQAIVEINGTQVQAPIVMAKILRLKQIAVSPYILSPQEEGVDRRDRSRGVEALGIPHASGGSVMEEAKFDAVLDILNDTDGKLLVFSQFSRALDRFSLKLRHASIGHVFYTGSNPKTRDDDLARFKRDPTCRCWLATLKAGGEGLNIPEASLVINLDLHWNPKVMEQAWSRAHRQGQTKPVTVINLIAEDTVDEWIDTLLTDKEDISDQITKRIAERSRSLFGACKATVGTA